MKKPNRKVLFPDCFTQVEEDLENNHRVIVSTDSVGILIYDLFSQKVVLTQQSRSPMKGVTDEAGKLVEIPAGRFDRDVGLVNLVIAEVKEEVGVDIQATDISLINEGEPLALCPGTNMERMHLVAVELDLSSVCQNNEVYGLASESEKIHRLVISIPDFINMKHQDMKTWAMAQYLKDVMANTPKFLR